MSRIDSNLGVYIQKLMASKGIAPLPRNYELFYESVVGSNDALKTKVAGLGAKPSQADVDKLIGKYLPSHSGEAFLHMIQHHVSRQVDKIIGDVDSERSDLNRFLSALTQVTDLMAENPVMSQQNLKKFTDFVAQASSSKLKRTETAAAAFEGRSEDLKILQQELQAYKKLANTDPLTELANRRAFDEEIANLYNEENRGAGNALLLLDIDKFKDFNDKFGHPAGDRVLSIVAKVINNNAIGGFVSRAGGEEFAVVLRDVSPQEAMEVGERIRAAVASTSLSGKGQADQFGKATVSIGVCMSADAANGNELYAKADQALYASKKNGRNKVTLNDLAKSANVPAELVAKGREKRYMLYIEAEEALGALRS